MSAPVKPPQNSIGRVCASCFGLSAFCVAVVAGMMSDNPMSTILARALVSMMACYAAGCVIGMCIARTTRDAIAQRVPVKDNVEVGSDTAAEPSRAGDAMSV